MIGALVAGITGSGGASLSSYESIATANGTGSSNQITFSSIPSGFKHLQIRYMSNDGGNNNFLRVNNDNGASSYARHYLRGDGATLTIVGTAAGANTSWLDGSFGGYDTNTMMVKIINILDYTSTSKNKTLTSFAGMDRNTSGGFILMASGLWLNTAAITRIDLYNSGSSFNTQSTFALYGIKEA